MQLQHWRTAVRAKGETLACEQRTPWNTSEYGIKRTRRHDVPSSPTDLLLLIVFDLRYISGEI